MVADQQTINVLKDVVVPLAASAIGAGAALIAGYYAIVVPQREQRKAEAATARFAISAFFEVAQLAATTTLKDESLGLMQTVLRDQIAGFVNIIRKICGPPG
jgi:hypothetical protein